MPELKNKSQFSFWNIGLCVAGIFAALFSAELLLHSFPQGKLLTETHNLVEGHFERLYRYDPVLGWTVKPWAQVSKWGVEIHTREDGIRSNGSEYSDKSRPDLLVLVLGDSFAFGDEVSDESTWPAQLEKILRQNHPRSSIQVLNAGVSSYGFDQILLRAEQLISKYRPDLVVIGYIEDDLFLRPVQSVRHGVPKPYFAVHHGELKLKNIPVPSPRDFNKNPLRKFLFLSKTGQFILDAWDRYWQTPGSFYDFQYIENSDIPETLSKLLDRILKLTRAFGVKMVLVDQHFSGARLYPELLENFEEDAARKQAADFLFINSIATQSPVSRTESLYNKAWVGHWSPYGHALFAQRVALKTENFIREFFP